MSDHMRNEEEILKWVYRRGGMLRLRTKAARVLSTSLVFAMLGGGMVFAFNRPPGDIEPAHDDKPLVIADDTPKPTPSPKPKPVTSTSPKPKPTATEKAAPKPTTGPKPSCLNSFDPDCGEFYWKTAPAKNQSLTLTANVSGGVAGSNTAFAVHVADADAKIWRDAYKIDFGDGSRIYGPAYKSCKKGYGPWTLPTRAGDSYDTTFNHTYAAAGTYTVYVKFFSVDRRDGAVPCQQAYGDYRMIELTVVVTDPSPEPSPSASPTI